MSIERDLALEWRRQYEAGATIEQIALDAHSSTPTVARALHAVDTPMRAAKPALGSRQKLAGDTTDGIRGKPQPRIHKVRQLTPRPGYRRRGRRL